MARRQTHLPDIWLISDARNDAGLERALVRLPRGSGFIYRHYHLDPAARRARFEGLRRVARVRGHIVILGGTAREAAMWGAYGYYGAPAKAGASGLGRVVSGGTRPPPSRGRGLSHKRGLQLAAAHSLRELRCAAGADAVLLSPVFPTRSHPGAKALGPLRFRLLAARAPAPVIALGGMTSDRARRLRHSRWAAIDGLCDKRSARIPADS